MELGHYLPVNSVFLSNHSQRVILENYQSSLIHVTWGVPQGVVLSPALILVYISNLPDRICHGTLKFVCRWLPILYKTMQSSQDATDLQQDS